MKTLPPATENACVAASLVTLESDLPRLVDRAQAWANGNVERIEKLPEPREVGACRAALGSKASVPRISLRACAGTWLAAFEKHLHAGGVTVAVVNIDMLLEPGGLLDELRAKGYVVDPP